MRVPTAITEPHLATATPTETDTLELPRGAVFDDPEFEPALQTLGRELTQVTGMLDEVARILGACPRCFGIDRACLRCEGHGSPGWHASGEPALLEYWLRHLGARPPTRG